MPATKWRPSLFVRLCSLPFADAKLCEGGRFLCAGLAKGKLPQGVSGGSESEPLDKPPTGEALSARARLLGVGKRC